MATKLITNESVAMLDLGKVAGELSARTVGILSIFLYHLRTSHLSELSQVQREYRWKTIKRLSSFRIKTLYGATL